MSARLEEEGAGAKNDVPSYAGILFLLGCLVNVETGKLF